MNPTAMDSRAYVVSPRENTSPPDASGLAFHRRIRQRNRSCASHGVEVRGHAKKPCRVRLEDFLNLADRLHSWSTSPPSTAVLTVSSAPRFPFPGARLSGF